MKVATSRRSNWTVAVINGRVDSVSAPDFQSSLAAAVDAGGSRLILDCTDLSYISSAGLRALLVTVKKVDALGGGVCMCELSGPIREVLEVSGFVRFLKVFDTVAEAEASFSTASPAE